MLRRPHQDEYAPYYESYIELVAEGNLIERLDSQKENTLELLKNITDEMGTYRYAPNKWSLKEVIGHIIDIERVLSYRLLRIARGDTTPLAGIDENQYVAATSFNNRPMAKLLQEFAAVRSSTILLCESLSDEEWLRRGTANQQVASARSIAYVIAGHELHHCNIIRERYLNMK